MPATSTSLYLDQNYLSGIAKDKPAFRELAPTVRRAVALGALAPAARDPWQRSPGQASYLSRW